MELFVRQVKNQSRYDEFVKQVNKQLNLHTLPFFSRQKTLKLYQPDYENEFLVYRFALIKAWIQTHERFDKKYINQLLKMLDNLLLKEELTGYELDYLDHYSQIVFSKLRNLKNLIVDFDVYPKENIYFKFDLEVVGQMMNQKDVNIIFEQGEVYITTQRIVFSSFKEYLSISYDNLKSIHLKPYWFEMKTQNDLKFCLISSNIFVFYVALERVLNLVKIRI